MNWYTQSIDNALQELQTNKQEGLKDSEASARLQQEGPNQLIQEKQTSPWMLFFHQFTDFMILVLIGACIVSALLGEWIDALAILAVVLFNGIMGFVQEFKAEKALAALKKLTAPTARILRDGQIHTLPASSIVPGDIISIETGDIIPVDLRLIESQRLTIEEASLTGESVPVSKNAAITYDKEIPLGDRKNMAFMSTIAASGKGLGVAVNTGMQTELGKIAHMVQSVGKETTPLQKRLEKFGKGLVWACLAICFIIFIMGIVRQESFIEMFLTSVALAVSAIPEGLPIVVTITLALGVQQMVKRHALIRRLPSVETLGCVQVICSDKTGTLTQNEMTVTRIATLDKCFEVSGVGYSPEGQFYQETVNINPEQDDSLMLLLKTGVLCNNARLYKNENGWRMMGDPTEGALIVAAGKAGILQEQLLNEYTLVEEFPFDSERKMMTVVYRDKANEGISFTKGAPDILLSLCKYVHTNDGVRELTEQDRTAILKTNEIFASQALRVLGFGYKTGVSGHRTGDVGDDVDTTGMQAGSLHHNSRTGDTGDDVEIGMTFVGIAGMIDPPREEVKQAVHDCKTAGIRTVMITGDHKVTATAIAGELDAFDETRDIALSGSELDALSDAEFRKIVDNVRVYARVSPANKLRVVTELKSHGYTVAMTGDGVNDAPAVKEADIGIAMGITGTDVTKEASDMVLSDDNFASIVAAVREGRRIYANIKKAIHFLLSCNMGEVIVIFVAMLCGMPLPLLPLQILWMNLVTDGLPALALAVEKEEKGIMRQPPRSSKEDIVSRQLAVRILIEGIFMSICTLSGYILYLHSPDAEKARTVAFTVLVFCQQTHLFNCRSLTISAFRIGLFTNWWLVLSVLFILFPQVAIVYIPVLQLIFKTVPLSLYDWGIVAGLSLLPLAGMEIYKVVRQVRQVRQV